MVNPLFDACFSFYNTNCTCVIWCMVRPDFDKKKKKTNEKTDPNQNQKKINKLAAQTSIRQVSMIKVIEPCLHANVSRIDRSIRRWKSKILWHSNRREITTLAGLWNLNFLNILFNLCRFINNFCLLCCAG